MGVTNFVAASVITTSTAMPALTSRRRSSADLYAAIPPVTPSTTRSELFAALNAAFIAWFQVRDVGSLHVRECAPIAPLAELRSPSGRTDLIRSELPRMAAR